MDQPNNIDMPFLRIWLIEWPKFGWDTGIDVVRGQVPIRDDVRLHIGRDGYWFLQ